MPESKLNLEGRRVERWKWLYPGMGVKRWIIVVIIGTLFFSLGITLLLNTRVLAFLEDALISFLTYILPGSELLVGVLLNLIGFLIAGLGMRNIVHSLISALPEAKANNLVDVVYRKRTLEKGPHIVVIGGGTGLSTLLRGLKQYTSNITAIVTVADDGGSSGRIREELGILPPGDIRNTLVALADTEPLMEKLFQYRFSWGEGLSGHSFGNLFIAAMTDITGDFEESIRAFSKVLAVSGQVLPSTLSPVKLKAVYRDGSEIIGESQIPRPGQTIERVYTIPDEAEPLPEALEAIANADVVVLGPGSLYTSIIPNLLVNSICEALVNTRATKVYVCNVMTQPGETDNMRASDHVAAILKHANHQPIIDCALFNNERLTTNQLRKYRKQKAYPVNLDLDKVRELGVEPICAPLLNQSNLVRHDSERLAKEIMKIAWRAKENHKKLI